MATAVAYDATLWTGDPEIVGAAGPWRVLDLRSVDDALEATVDASHSSANDSMEGPMGTSRSNIRLGWLVSLLGALALSAALAPAAAAQDWTADCEGRIEAMLMPEPLDGSLQDGTPARVRAIVVNDCVADMVWFVVTDVEGLTYLAQGTEILLDDRPA